MAVPPVGEVVIGCAGKAPGLPVVAPPDQGSVAIGFDELSVH